MQTILFWLKPFQSSIHLKLKNGQFSTINISKTKHYRYRILYLKLSWNFIWNSKITKYTGTSFKIIKLIATVGRIGSAVILKIFLLNRAWGTKLLFHFYISLLLCIKTFHLKILNFQKLLNSQFVYSHSCFNLNDTRYSRYNK